MAQILTRIRNPQAYLLGLAKDREPSAAFREHIEVTNAVVSGQLETAVESLTFRRPQVREPLVEALLTKRDYDRAWFVRLGYESTAGDWRAISPALAASELSYASVVILDDIVDEGVKRFGKPCLYRSRGPSAAIYVAELLRSLAMMQLLRTFKDVDLPSVTIEEVIRRNEIALCDLNYGQYLDVICSGRDPESFTDDDYLNLIRLTTGADIANCLATGALLAQGTTARLADLERIGNAIGTIMQIRDDLLDYAFLSDDIDKTTGRDLANLRMKLPYVVAYRFANSTEREVLRRGMQVSEPNAWAEIRRLIISNRTVSYIYEMGRVLHSELISLLSVAEMRVDAKAILQSFAEEIISFEKHD